MLFVVVAEGRLLIVGLDGFGSWWTRSDMTGSRTEAIFGMLMDALALSVVFGMRGDMMMMVVAGELYG
jgi:hypothetical protein